MARGTPGRLLRVAGLAFLVVLVAGCSKSVAIDGEGEGDVAAGATIGRVLTLRDHNTRVVVLGTMLLGLAAGITGTYMLLRRRALVGDALSHATLPGIAIAFIVMVALGGTGKFLPGLLAGAVVMGFAGVGTILLIKTATRIKEDAALGIVLSVSFGLGIALLGIIQKMPTGTQAGLESFIYGKTASMLSRDAAVIGAAALLVILVCVALYKEFAILSFDADFAASQGWPVVALDVIMMLLVTGVTVIGLQAVGLILVVALLIIPAAAARFWTDQLRTMLVASGLFGAASGYAGASLSAMVPRLPAGAIIVIVAAGIFAVSMAFGVRRGIVVRGLEHVRGTRSVARAHLLRAMYEWLETRGNVDEPARAPMPRADLLRARSWSQRRLARTIRRQRRAGLIDEGAAGDVSFRLTAAGLEQAARVVRDHRLWELFLINHADIAPSHVDRDADQIEHVLGPRMVSELERQLLVGAGPSVPPSPHLLGAGGGASRSAGCIPAGDAG